MTTTNDDNDDASKPKTLRILRKQNRQVDSHHSMKGFENGFKVSDERSATA